MARPSSRPTVDEIVNAETACLMERGYPLFLNKKEIRESFGLNEADVRRIMATKEPLISGRYALRDVLYAIHGA